MSFEHGAIYYAAIDSGTTTTAKTGNPQIVIQLTITHQSIAGTWKPVDHEQRRMYISLTDDAWPYSEPKLNHLGFNGSFTKPQFEMKGVSVTCKHEDYKGQQKERWELADFGGGGELTQADEGTLRRLNAKWKATAAPAPAPTATPSSPPSEPSGDDIPF